MAKGRKKKEDVEVVNSETITTTENTETVTESIIVEEIKPEAEVVETPHIWNKRTGR